jgi:hypothetical protein
MATKTRAATHKGTPGVGGGGGNHSKQMATKSPVKGAGNRSVNAVSGKATTGKGRGHASTTVATKIKGGNKNSAAKLVKKTPAPNQGQGGKPGPATKSRGVPGEGSSKAY